MNALGLELIKEVEGFRLNAYRCPAGKWTIGYGHTAGVYPGMKITKKEAAALLESDLIKYEGIIKSLVKGNINSNQEAALVSLCFNIGETAFRKSTLLKLVNQGLYLEASEQFIKWCKVNKQISEGLFNRRLKEKALFNLTEKEPANV